MSAFITEEQFKTLYDYAIEQPHDALVIDATKGKPIFKKNFEKLIFFSWGISVLFLGIIYL